MNVLGKSAAAALAGLAMVAATSLAAPQDAHAGGKAAAAFVGGLFLGSMIAHGAQAGYASPTYPSYQNCWTNQVLRYDYYGNPYYVNETYCN